MKEKYTEKKNTRGKHSQGRGHWAGELDVPLLYILQSFYSEVSSFKRANS